MAWTTDDIGDLTGRRAVVTGATSGIGTQTAMELARHGADVVITARDSRKADETVTRLGSHAPGAKIEVLELNLADLADTVAAAQRLVDSGEQVDILVNNAGVMVPPHQLTRDGFELQIGTNHLGHFAWTATLWPLLREGSRIVTVASLAHTSAHGIDFASLTTQGSARPYKRWTSYAESKLANLLFAFELDRRAKTAGLPVVSVAAHPGYSATNLTRTGTQTGGRSIPGIALHQISAVIGQPARAGAWPSLMAATDPSLSGGEYLGPAGFRQLRGRPQRVGASKVAHDQDLADRLWSASETATGTSFSVA